MAPRQAAACAGRISPRSHIGSTAGTSTVSQLMEKSLGGREEDTAGASRSSHDAEGLVSNETTGAEGEQEAATKADGVDALTSAVEGLSLAPRPAESAEVVAECRSEEDAGTGHDTDDSEGGHTEGSEYDSCSDEERGEAVQSKARKEKKLISRGPTRTKVYSRDRQAGGVVYTCSHEPSHGTAHEPSYGTADEPSYALNSYQALSGQQWWTDYRQPQVSHVTAPPPTVDNLPESEADSELYHQAYNLMIKVLPGEVVEEFFQDLTNSEGSRSDDEGVGEMFASSPESTTRNLSPAYSYSSNSSGVESPGSMPPSPTRVYAPVPSPPLYKPIRPKAPSAREEILARFSKQEKDAACLRINLASEDKLLRAGDVDKDTNLTVLVRAWEKNRHQVALLYAMVERMKFIKGGLSRKNLRGENALYLAATCASADPLVAKYIAEVMVECGEDVNEVDGNGNTVVHYLCGKGDSHSAVLQQLLSLGKFDTNLPNKYGVTPLHVAWNKGAEEMIKMLSCERSLARPGGVGAARPVDSAH